MRAQTVIAALSALALFGASEAARAQSPSAPVTVSTNDNLGILLIDPANHAASALQPPHRSLQWDQKNRWGLKLDMTQPAGREMELRDVQAGAYYRVTPSLRVGGAVALTEQPVQPDHNSPLPNLQAPQVKLETTFKF